MQEIYKITYFLKNYKGIRQTENKEVELSCNKIESLQKYLNKIRVPKKFIPVIVDSQFYGYGTAKN